MIRAADILGQAGVLAAAEPQAHISTPDIMLVTQLFTNAKGVTETRVANVLAAFRRCLARNGIECSDTRCVAEMLDDGMDAEQYVLYADEPKPPIDLRTEQAVARVMAKLHRELIADPVLIKAGCTEHSRDTSDFVRDYIREARSARPGSVMAAAEPGHSTPGTRGDIERYLHRLGMVVSYDSRDWFTAPDADPGFNEVRFYDNNTRVSVLFYMGVVFDAVLPLKLAELKKMLKLLTALDKIAGEFNKATERVRSAESAEEAKLRSALKAAGADMHRVAIKFAPYDYTCFMLDDGSGRIRE